MIVKPFSIIRRIIIMLTLLWGLSWFAYADLNKNHQWDLPRQDLGQTLIAIGKQSEISIIFPSSLTQGLISVPIKGAYSLEQVLDMVFTDQPLQWQALNNRVVTINRKVAGDYQEQPVFESPAISELVVVGKQITGSRLKRLDYEGSAPVDIITSPELDASGVQTVSEYLKFIPAVVGNSTSTSVSNGGDGTAKITLRGLPTSNTLVLINGIRTAYSGMAGDSVDLNTIPLIAVERIEVLKDGASAIYGSDAIAGVVNIIFKENYDGLTFEQYYGQTSRHDLTTSNTGLVVGKSFDNSDLMLIASHYDQEGIFSRDRSISINADGRDFGGMDLRSSATPFTRIRLADDSVVRLQSALQDPNDPASYRIATDEDLYNYREATSSVSPSKRSGIYLSGVHSFNPELSATMTTGFTESQATVTYAPYPLFTGFESVPVIVGANNPYNPFGTELVDLRRRLVELGPRYQHTSEKATRVNGKVEYQTSDSHWDVGFNWNQTRANAAYEGMVNIERVSDALGDECGNVSGCVPLDLFGPPGSISAAQIEYIAANTKGKGLSSLYEITSNFDTTVNSFLAAPVGLAIGAGIREEAATLTKRKEAHIQEPITIDGDRKIWEFYAETILPLIQYKPAIYRLELEIASRYSDYDDFGSTNNPKFGVRYRPQKDLLLRSTRSKGFRAPGLHQMLQEESVSFDVLQDPCTDLENVGVLPGCELPADTSRRQFAVYTGGNLNLEPEKATSKTFGLVWTPEMWKNFHFSIDWFEIDQEDIIDSRAQFIIDQNAKFGALSDRIVRDESGNLVAVYATNLNVGNLTVEGFDATMLYRLPSTKFGNFVFSLNGSNLRHYRQQLDAGGDKQELAGTFVDQASEGAGALPDWKINGGFSWLNKNWEFNYSIFYVSPLTETIPFAERRRRIQSWTSQNFRLNYVAGKNRNIQVSIGIDNAFDKMPPFAASAFNDNFDQRNYELKGRNFYAQLKYQL